MATFATDLILHSNSPELTQAIGRALGHVAEPGLVVALIGPLGAGKTQFVRGVAEGLDVPDSRIVSSPTFVLIQEYEGRLPIFHFDTYRLTDADQFLKLGPEEYFEGSGVCLVEWADRVLEHLPPDNLNIQFVIESTSSRVITIRATGPRSFRLLERFDRGQFEIRSPG